MFDSALAPDSGPLAVLEAHWQSLRGPQCMPSRGELRPQEITAALPWLFVAEPVAPAVLRIRHAGCRFAAIAGMEPRGMPLCAFFSPEGRDVLRPLLAQMQARPSILGLGLTAGRGIVTPRIPARLLMLPLSDGEPRPDRFLGVLVAETDGTRPLRFDHDDSPVRLEQLRPAGLLPRIVASGGTRSADRGERPALQLVVSNG